MSWRGVIREYRAFMPEIKESAICTLNEGNTLLLEAEWLSRRIGNNLKIYLKFEGQNPTGSFKDRGMTMAISKAIEEGAKAVICASTGNTSAAAAAFSAVADLPCAVLIPQGKIAKGKLSQAIFYGAKVMQVQGNFDEALDVVREIGKNYPVTVVNSINPYRIPGQRSAAFEVIDQLGGLAPDYQCIPVGNAANIVSYWEGYQQYRAAGKFKNNLPKMLGFQAEGSAPIVQGHPIEKPETIATAIRIGNPASWQRAVQVVKESEGLFDTVTDQEILAAQKLIAHTQGIFCEPASAASVAGLVKKAKQGYFKQGASVVCILTGHGLKDPDSAITDMPDPYVIQPDKQAVLKILGLN